MGRNEGRIMYVPKYMLKEIDIIKHGECIQSNAEAMRKIVNYAQKGRQIHPNIPFDEHMPKKKKRDSLFDFDF